VGRELVLHPVPGDERHPLSLDGPDHDRRRRRPVRRLQLDLLHVVEERVEPGPSEHPDPDRLGGDRAQADSFDDVDGFESDCFDEEPSVFDPDEPSDFEDDDSDLEDDDSDFDSPEEAFDREERESVA
jgi:hypothetical protein